MRDSLTTSAKIRTYLIDDHHVVRQAVASMLESTDSIEVVGQNGDCRVAVSDVCALQPNVVLLDVKVPRFNGLSVIADIMKASSDTRIVVFTMCDNPVYVWETIHAGARGYLLKTATTEELIRAITAMAAGGGYLQAEVAMPVLERCAHDPRGADARKSLTMREIQILECLADGLTNKKIAVKLGLRDETVKSHVSHIFEKLAAQDRAHAVAIALRRGIIE